MLKRVWRVRRVACSGEKVSARLYRGHPSPPLPSGHCQPPPNQNITWCAAKVCCTCPEHSPVGLGACAGVRLGGIRRYGVEAHPVLLSALPSRRPAASIERPAAARPSARLFPNQRLLLPTMTFMYFYPFLLDSLFTSFFNQIISPQCRLQWWESFSGSGPKNKGKQFIGSKFYAFACINR